ncbi:MAG TPA: TadE/TadG family type IV pilus assembly protein [Acidimicrobiia bacterium]|nr:TadE/TadG family type IV pilus assembly protein [Acidimicrobiia bacterium]
MRSLRHRTPRSEDGAVAVELAFVLPILVLLLVGIVEFSITYNRVQALHAAAREGARVASQSYATSSQIKQRVTEALDPISFPNPVEIAVTPSSDQPCNLRTGEKVTVAVTVEDEIDIPLWPGGPMTVTLDGKGEFRCE